ncbi:MAG: ankyrin repeat domain-containing protein [Alphaproteobacteria bacterium]
MATVIDEKHEKYWLSLKFCETIRSASRPDMSKVIGMLNEGLPIDSIVVNRESFVTLAAFWGHQDLMRELLKRGAPVNHVNLHGDTAFTYAMEKGNRDIVEMLIDAEADICHQVRFAHKAPLTLAQKHGWTDIEQKITTALEVRYLEELPALAQRAITVQTPIKAMPSLKLKPKSP